MKSILLFSLFALGTAQAQNSLQALIKKKLQQQQQQQQAPGSAGYRPPAVHETRGDWQPRQEQPRDWKPAQQQPTQPPGRPGSSGSLPSMSDHDSRPAWPGTREEPRRTEPPYTPPQIDPRYRPSQNQPGYRPLREDELFDRREERRDPRTPQQMIKDLKEQHAWEKERERAISPGINRPQYRLPIQRPERTRLPEQSYRIWQNYTNNWSQWTIERNADINRFSRQRPSSWQRLEHYRSSDQCWQNYGRDDWWQWRRDFYDYRTQRCYELWNASYWVAGQLFDTHWWNYCRWAGRPVPADVPGWWWFQPVTWESLAQHLRLRRPEMQPHDPGVDVVYWRDRVYINGQDAGSAERHRDYDRDLAAKDWGWEPPFPGGRFDWLPLGVWALTPQEYGEATMFFQLAISREGLITGAYTNILTGEEYPIMGRADVNQQRVAWRIGSTTNTVIETGLGGFSWDVAGAFLHFARGDTQLWQLTRLPTPSIAPGAVRLPRGRY